jgi:hypothetical protein
LAYPVVIALGFAYFAVVTSLSTVLQSHLADEIRGRVMALWIMAFGGTVPIGVLAAGAVAAHTSITAVVLFGAAVALVLILAAADQRHLAFSLAVRASEPGVIVPPGHEACQRDVDVEEPFDSLTILPAAFFHPVPRLVVTVFDRASGTLAAAGELGDGHPENKPTTIELSRSVRRGSRVDVCFRNLGRWKLAFFSGPGTDNEPSFATLDGRYIRSDILIDFLRSKPRTTLDMVPDIFRRATLFHPRWVGTWTFWLLAALLAVAVPLLCALALRRA